MSAPFGNTGRAHARLGPSDSSRWLSCPGAVNFTKNYPNESSTFADEGTAAHWIREQCLDLGFDAYDFIGTKVRVNGALYECDAEMADFLQPGIDEIRQFDGEVFVEKRINLSRWMPGQFGTLDSGVAGRHLIVISDLKYGRGVPVSAVKNTQQMIYALGFWDNFARHVTDATMFLIIIDQPRHPAGGGYWEVTLDELLAFGEELRVKAAATTDPSAPLIPTQKGCAWCPAANLPNRKGGCPAHNADMFDLLDLEFDDLDAPEQWAPPQIDGLTPERIIALATKKREIEQWLNFIGGAALQHLLDNGPTAGQKAVYGRMPPRKWATEGAAEAFLKQRLGLDATFNKKLITPTQALKAMGKGAELPGGFITQEDPKPTIAPIEDKRDAIAPLVDDFEDYGDDLGTL
ncbi:DUF2800 domain-containing protein [Gemmobacter lutimaris]|uniref:DUF2800 domain-containing protein n=1 Tax=Gemmobacter lutimaris TaxID=2306023 RepID=A0A398BQS7_9RHOB|nr:DUF2800 domain-containing protein [Gemmobacter lutimaris]RID91837.1 DUF2800 domain-containing protein [Gemmobacter lutimaris]